MLAELQLALVGKIVAVPTKVLEVCIIYEAARSQGAAVCGAARSAAQIGAPSAVLCAGEVWLPLVTPEVVRCCLQGAVQFNPGNLHVALRCVLLRAVVTGGCAWTDGCGAPDVGLAGAPVPLLARSKPRRPKNGAALPPHCVAVLGATGGNNALGCIVCAGCWPGKGGKDVAYAVLLVVPAELDAGCWPPGNDCCALPCSSNCIWRAAANLSGWMRSSVSCALRAGTYKLPGAVPVSWTIGAS